MAVHTANTRSPAEKPKVAAGIRKKGLHTARYCTYIPAPMLPVARSSACAAKVKLGWGQGLGKGVGRGEDQDRGQGWGSGQGQG